MWRLLLIASTALGACAGGPTSGPAHAPIGQHRTAGALPDDNDGRASDVLDSLFPRGLPLPALPRARAPSSERPPWLPSLPETIERYPVPEEWGRDTLAAPDLPGAVFTNAPR
jgi:hypothetical protein